MSIDNKHPFTVSDKREKDHIFIHSCLDDYGLSASEFRVYAHLARRADNKSGLAYPSIETMSESCRLNEKTVREALRCLVSNFLVQRTERPGHPSLFELLPKSAWAKTYTPNTDSDTPLPKEGRATPPKGGDTTPPKGGDTTPPKGGEGYPSQRRVPEGNPLKVIQKGGTDDEASVEKGSGKRGVPNDCHKFVELWTAEYPKYHDDQIYIPINGRDHKAAQHLLKQLPAERLIRGAVEAWQNSDGFWCKQAATLHGFQTAFNNICNELRVLKKAPKKIEYNL